MGRLFKRSRDDTSTVAMALSTKGQVKRMTFYQFHWHSLLFCTSSNASHLMVGVRWRYRSIQKKGNPQIFRQGIPLFQTFFLWVLRWRGQIAVSLGKERRWKGKKPNPEMSYATCKSYCYSTWTIYLSVDCTNVPSKFLLFVGFIKYDQWPFLSMCTWYLRTSGSYFNASTLITKANTFSRKTYW